MRSKIETTSASALSRVQEKVGSLIGAEVQLALQSASLTKKEDYVDRQKGRNIVVVLELSGTYEGLGCLIISEKNAIRLGGKMLMLPTLELNEIISRAEYEQETRYAFDEIARSIAESFLENFQNSRLRISQIICKNQKTATDRQAAGALKDLDPEQMYYQVTADMNLADLNMGQLSLLLPAFIFICGAEFADDAEPVHQDPGDRPGAHSDFANYAEISDNHGALTFAGSGSKSGVIDTLLRQCLLALGRELGGLLGGNVEFSEKETLSVDKNDIIATVDVIDLVTAVFSVNGAINGEIYLFLEKGDAVKMGSLLTTGIEQECEESVETAYFSSDCQDCFTEICNIISSVLSSVCQSAGAEELVFARKRLLQRTSGEMVSGFGDLLADDHFCLCIVEMLVENGMRTTLHLLFPVKLVDLLENSVHTPESPAVEAELPDSNPEEEKRDLPLDSSDVWHGSVLIINDSENDASAIRDTLATKEITYHQISPAEEMNKATLQNYRAIFLVVKKLDELALGIAIKINALSSIPLIVAASQWTQADVMKAVRYGVSDILMTPADSSEVLEKMRDLKRITV